MNSGLKLTVSMWSMITKKWSADPICTVSLRKKPCSQERSLAANEKALQSRKKPCSQGFTPESTRPLSVRLTGVCLGFSQAAASSETLEWATLEDPSISASKAGCTSPPRLHPAPQNPAPQDPAPQDPALLIASLAPTPSFTLVVVPHLLLCWGCAPPSWFYT